MTGVTIVFLVYLIVMALRPGLRKTLIFGLPFELLVECSEISENKKEVEAMFLKIDFSDIFLIYLVTSNLKKAYRQNFLSQLSKHY